MTNEKKDESVDFVESVSVWKELQKPWKWYNHGWWWIRHGIWQKISELRWRIPNTYGRMKRGWGYADTWGFSYYLAKVISGGLKHLRQHKCGYGSTIDPITGKYEYDEKRWDAVLDDMIYTFETALDITERDLLYTRLEDWTEEQYQEHLKFAEEMNKKFRTDDGNIEYKVMTKEEVIRYERGFTYFQRYFYNLWD